jgi:hypothetical protein
LRWAGITRGILIHDSRRTSIGDFEQAQVAPATGIAVSGHKYPSVYNNYNVQNKICLIEAMKTKEAWQDGQRRLVSGPLQAPAELMAAMQLQCEAGLQREAHLTGVIEVLNSLLNPGSFSTDLAHSPDLADWNVAD